MSPQVHYSGINETVECSGEGMTLLDASIESKIPHLHECGGNGKCTTCRVRVISGMENLSPKTRKEVAMSMNRRWDPTLRLACQSKVKGDVTIQRLIWSNAEVNSLQKETVPEGTADERDIAILFCDLRNYTKLSSRNESFDIAYLLNRFYTELGEPILMNNGIIYQYVGDEIVGVFGTEGGNPEKNCSDAIRAAIGMRYAIERLNKIELKDFDIELKIGVGINYGKAYVGHLGHPTHRQFSVIGDPVNVASRIQGQTKNTGSDILISKAIYYNSDRENIRVGRRFAVELAGKDDIQELYEVHGFNKMDLQLELQASLHFLLKDEDAFASLFYSKVFEKAPFVRALFKNNMRDQGRLLTHMLGGIVYSLSRPDNLKLGLQKLGKNHVKYGVMDDYYPVVKAAMLETITEIMGEHCTDEVLNAWKTAMDFVIKHMSTKKPEKRIIYKAS